MDTIENKLKELILNNYKSLREFTLKIEMPYSTFDTILKRGVDKANIINILKICNELNISADKLANGTIEFNNNLAPNNNANLSQEETTLLENFNKLNSKGKEKLLDYSDDLATNVKYLDNSNNEISATKEDDEFTKAKKKALKARRKAEQYFKEHPEQMPIASHDKEGDFTEEDYKHDDDLMMDDDLWND